MSQPAKKGRTSKQKKKAEPKRVAKAKVPKPLGVPPRAIVEVRHGGEMMQRQARGFSMGEVANAKVSVGQARAWGLLVDDKRKSVLEANIASLSKWVPRTEKTAEQRVEGEVKKMEKAVEKEARRVEKEARKVEKEAKKVEGEVVEKVEAPIKKRAAKRAAPKKETG